MTGQEFDIFTEEVMQKAKDMLFAKAKDYASGDDRLINFKSVAEVTRLSPFQVWSVYIAKHFDSVMQAIDQYPSLPMCETEPIDGRIMDILCYQVLFLALLEEIKQERKQQKNKV